MQRRSKTVACKCNMQNAKLLSVKIDKSLSGGWEVPSGQEDCISAFLDLQRVNLKLMMGNMRLHENTTLYYSFSFGLIIDFKGKI